MQIVYVNQSYVDVSEERDPLAGDKFEGFTFFFFNIVHFKSGVLVRII